MNNLETNFDQIMDFAAKYGLPLGKKRAILREYLQVKILSMIYSRNISRKLYFVGGTSLRLLRGLDRFSEDLDFDLQKVKRAEIISLMTNIKDRLNKEAIETILYKNITGKRVYFELRFPYLLYNLKIGKDPNEKLTIKFDFEDYWKEEKAENIILTRFGYTTLIPTINLSQVFVQKLAAYLNRVQTQPRDIYDLVWLKAQETNVDSNFMKANKIQENLILTVGEKYIREEKRLKFFKAKLKPFLLDENNVNKLDLFPHIIHG